jgi:collagenase-like PrtC family protease
MHSGEAEIAVYAHSHAATSIPSLMVIKKWLSGIKYLLSLKDMNRVKAIGDLVAAGVTSSR